MKRKGMLWLVLIVFLLVLAGCEERREESDTTVQVVQEGPIPEFLSPSCRADPPKSKHSAVDQKLQTYLDRMTKKEKAAQLFITTPEAVAPKDHGLTAGKATRKAIRRCPVGGLIYMGANLQDIHQTKTMIAAIQKYSMDRIGLPAFISVDEEGGTVARIGKEAGFPVPRIGPMSKVGATKDPELARKTGQKMGRYLSALGFNLDFAPVADVLADPDYELLRWRCFGTDPKLVGSMALAFSEGLESQGVYSTLKHFPGHGAAAQDTHLGRAVTEKTIWELLDQDLIPFQKGIDADAPFIMVSHISLPYVTGNNIPASLNRGIIQGLLREEMGYDGIVITDALDMKAISQNYDPGTAAVLALQAGADILLTVSDFYPAYQGVLHALKKGELTEERLDQSLARILEVKLAMTG